MVKRKTKKTEAGSKGPKIEISERPDYKAIYASGVFGGLDPNGGRIVFFLDRIKPKMKNKPRGAMELENINRELQIEIQLSPPQFLSVAKWMGEHAQRFEKKVKTGKVKAKATEPSGTSYIG